MSRSLYQRIQDGAAKTLVGIPLERTLLVGQAPAANLTYPAGYFTSIQAAINAGAALSPAPSQSNPVQVLIYPGTYTENITLKPFVYVAAVDSSTGHSRSGKTVQISGTINYTSTSAVSETVACASLWFSGANATTINTSGNTGGGGAVCIALFVNCFWDTATSISCTGRAAFPSNDLVSAATAVPVVTAKAAGSFTVTVPAGGATYDYTVVHN